MHRLAVAALAREADEPADAERQAAVRIHFDRHLVVAAADAARFDFERGLDVLDRLLEDLERVVAGLLLDGATGSPYMIFSAVLRLPSLISVLMNFVTSELL